MGSKDITVTEGRFNNVIDNAISRVTTPRIQSEVANRIDETLIRTGIVTKFYQYLDKAEVQLDHNNQRILCKILHRFGGELTEYYTPTGETSYCKTLHEPCVIPRGKLHVCVLNINDKDSDEHLILGFYNNEELIGINPAEPGNIKIVTRGGTNQFWIKFGYDGLDLRLPDTTTTNVGDMDADMTPVDYADSDNVYTKEEVYTKQEVDELIQKAINKALGE